MQDLQRYRQSTQVFAGKHGFITLRDLFRWADRHPGTYEELAKTGFMLLAERLRKPDEKTLVKVILL
jgi:midasin